MDLRVKNNHSGQGSQARGAQGKGILLWEAGFWPGPALLPGILMHQKDRVLERVQAQNDHPDSSDRVHLSGAGST